MAVQSPDELPEWVERLRGGGPIPLSDSSSRQAAAGCSWACIPGNLFQVRGADYEKSKVKIAGGESLLQPLAVDFFRGPSKLESIMERTDCRVRVALDAAVAGMEEGMRPPFVLVFNYQLCTSANHSLVLYFVTFEAAPQGSLLQRFVDGDDGFRKSRLKALVRMPEAPRVVQALVGARWPACVVGNFVNCRYRRGENYLQVNFDMGSSPLIGSAVHCTFGLARLMVVDLAFVLEGIYADELPELILGAIRIHKLDPSSAAYIDDMQSSVAALIAAPPDSSCATSVLPDKPAAPLPGNGAPGFRAGLLRLLGKKGKAF